MTKERAYCTVNVKKLKNGISVMQKGPERGDGYDDKGNAGPEEGTRVHQ